MAFLFLFSPITFFFKLLKTDLFFQPALATLFNESNAYLKLGVGKSKMIPMLDV